ncbi:MAG: hypothetical protein K8S21_09665 [Gemmatimonadetes bacterium]|nr:hypothetical protein [Gemmatimonadota bacterium]
MRTLLVLALALGGSAVQSPVAAQDTRGLPWVGCWQAVDGVETQGRVCVIPEHERDLRIVSFDAQGKSTESTLTLNGERKPVSAAGCSGWEQARPSSDGDRILVDAQIRCGDTPQRTISTAFVITPAGYWMQVNGSGIARIANASIRLYRPVESYAEFPAEIRAAVSPHVAEAEAARFVAMDRAVSAKDLVELDAMGVSAPVIDLVVAASYPKTFAIDADGTTSAIAPVAGGRSEIRSSMSYPFYWSNGFPMLSFYDMALLESCLRFGSYSCPLMGSRLGYSPYGFPGFGGYYGGGYGGYGGYWPGAGVPVVVRPVDVPRGDVSGNAGGGRAVRGRGYTSGNDDVGTRVASPRSGNAGTSQNAGSGGSSTSAGSGGGSAGSAGGSSGATPRTAKPRDP